MKKLDIRVCLVLLIVQLHISAQTNTEFEKAFGWITGSWFLETEKGFILEEWKIENDSTYYGASYFIPNNGKITKEQLTIQTFHDLGRSFEKLTIAKLPTGIFYIPLVPGQNNNQPVYFKLISTTENKFHFQNLEHDFPQNIIYIFIDEDHITAIVSGPGKEEEVKDLFAYTRFK